MSVREIQGFVAESYGTEVSPDFISFATDEVMDETAIKLLWLALRNVLKKSVRAAFDWKSAMTANLHVYGYR